MLNLQKLKRNLCIQLNQRGKPTRTSPNFSSSLVRNAKIAR